MQRTYSYLETPKGNCKVGNEKEEEKHFCCKLEGMKISGRKGGNSCRRSKIKYH